MKNLFLILFVALLSGFGTLKAHAESAAPSARNAGIMSDPHALRAMAGRFEFHAQTMEDEGRRVFALQVSGGDADGLFNDPDGRGAMQRAQAGSLETEHQNIDRDILAASDFWGGAGSSAFREFVAQVGKNFQILYEQLNKSDSANLAGLPQVDQAFRNIVNLMHGARDGLVRAANEYEEREQQKGPTASAAKRNPPVKKP